MGARIAFALLAAAAGALGQVTSGTISGYVFDPSQRPMANATVSVADPTRGFRRETTTGISGDYRFLDLPPAIYTMTASAPGFDPASTGDLRMTVDSRLRVNFHPALAGTQQSLTVPAEPPVIQAGSSELGAVLDRERIDRLPLNRRDFLQLALLAPGVSPPVQDSALSTRGSFAMHANGGREEYNNFLLDGVDNNDPDTNRYVLEPSVDAIQEFKIATSSYSAEYGRNAGGQVNVITRSGTNELHGFLYEYLRNRVLDARNFFDGSGRPDLIRNQFGGGIGGPVFQDRTFFFASFDGLRERRGLTRLGTVPTNAERAGNLTELATVVRDPFTGRPFPGNVIPGPRVAPLALRVLDLFPRANLPGLAGNYLGQPVLRDSQSQGTGRLDHRLTPGDHLTLRYSYGIRDVFEPYAEESVDLPGFGDYLTDAGHNALVQYQRVLGPRAVNSLLVGFNRGARREFPQNYQTDVNQAWGVGYLPTRASQFGYPGIAVAGFSRVGDTAQLPIDRHITTYQLTEVLSQVRAQHELKLGVEIRKLYLNGFVDVYSRGVLSFSGALTGAGLGDLLLGLASFGLQSQSYNPQTLRTTATNLFFQDDWKLRPGLTLNLGLRYEYNAPPTDPTNRMAALNPATGQVVQVGTGGISRSGLRPDRNNLAPRLGFAWAPAARLAIRGGYGMFYDAGTAVVNSSLYYNPPFYTIRVFFPTRTRPLTLDDPFPTTGGFAPPPSLSTLSPDLSTSYLQHWNLDVQRELARLGTLSVAYAGSKGTHLIRSRDLNQPPPGPGGIQSRRPYPEFGNIFYTETGGNSAFHALEVSFNRPFTRGLSLLATYTLSKSIDDTSAFLGTKADKNFPQDSRNYRAERALSSFDMHQRAVLAWVCRLPAGFETSAMVTAQGGQPFTPVLRFDNSHTGNTGGIFGSDRPNLLRDAHLATPGPAAWFDTSAFAIPALYTFGSAGRNILRGPGLVSLDVSLARRFALRERAALLAEVQAFNLLNHANFDLPERFADEPATFGRILSAKAPRQIQLALRLSF